MTSRVAVIAGGGPVGSLAAIALASQGWKVEVFEGRRKVLNGEPEADDTRAYNIGLSSRGITSFERFGVDTAPLVASHGGRTTHAMYNTNGKVFRSGETPETTPPSFLGVYRDELGVHLRHEAQRLCPAAINFHFDCPVSSIDFDQQTVSVADSNHPKVRYDLLVGADGANSVVRSQLAERMPTAFVKRMRHKAMYTTASVSLPAEEVPAHGFMQMHHFPGGMVIWVGRRDGDRRIAYVTTQEQADEIMEGNLQRMQGHLAQGLQALPQSAKKALGDVLEAKPSFHPTSHWTRVSQFHGPQTVLLGDAAHTMTPVMGQGLNCGLEDVAVFANTLEQHKGNVATALPAYSKARGPDVEGILSVNELMTNRSIFVPIQEKLKHMLWLYSHKVLFMAHMIAHMVPHKALPSLFAEPSMVKMLKGKVPYRTVVESMYKDGLILAGICALCTVCSVY